MPTGERERVANMLPSLEQVKTTARDRASALHLQRWRDSACRRGPWTPGAGRWRRATRLRAGESQALWQRKARTVAPNYTQPVFPCSCLADLPLMMITGNNLSSTAT